MGKFKGCYKRLCQSNVSNAWILLHQCVEDLARTKGDSFQCLFGELEKQFHFQRRSPALWPDLVKIKLAADYLKLDRALFLEKLRVLTLERKKEKNQGKRKSTNMELLLITRKQARYARSKIEYLS